MFTSRAEYRLQLREDNADLRLTAAGALTGACRRSAVGSTLSKNAKPSRKSAGALRVSLYSGRQRGGRGAGAPVKQAALARVFACRTIKATGAGLRRFKEAVSPADHEIADNVAEQVAIQLKYAGYIDRQQQDIDRLKRHEAMKIPTDLDFARVDGLSNEIRQKLTEVRPENLAHAGRVPGVTPAALSLLLVHLKKREMSNTGRAIAHG